jgi:hypothetical protein
MKKPSRKTWRKTKRNLEKMTNGRTKWKAKEGTKMM